MVSSGDSGANLFCGSTIQRSLQTNSVHTSALTVGVVGAVFFSDALNASVCFRVADWGVGTAVRVFFTLEAFSSIVVAIRSSFGTIQRSRGFLANSVGSAPRIARRVGTAVGMSGTSNTFSKSITERSSCIFGDTGMVVDAFHTNCGVYVAKHSSGVTVQVCGAFDTLVVSALRITVVIKFTIGVHGTSNARETVQTTEGKFWVCAVSVSLALNTSCGSARVYKKSWVTISSRRANGRSSQSFAGSCGFVASCVTIGHGVLAFFVVQTLNANFVRDVTPSSVGGGSTVCIGFAGV